MKTRRGYESRDEAYEIVVHVAGIAERGGARRHDCRDERVDLSECGRVDTQAFGCDAIQCRIVQNNLV